jgi:hypothetical protein
MIEIDMVGQGVDPLPENGPIFLERGRDLLNFGFVGPSYCVAIHAGLQGGDTRVAGTFGPGVAVEARDVVVARMQAMGKCNRLRRRVPRSKAIRLGSRTHREQGGQHCNGSDGQDHAPKTVSWVHVSVLGQTI